MEISVPTYIKVIKGDSQKKMAYRASLLFDRDRVSENVVLQRAITKLTRETRKLFSAIGKEWKQRSLVNLTFNPAGLRQTDVRFEFELNSRYWRCKYFLVTFPAFGRNVAFCPEIPHVWFEYESGELEKRAGEVFPKFFRDFYKGNSHDRDEMPLPTDFNAETKRWLTWIDIPTTIDQSSARQETNRMMALWTNSSNNGEVELDNCGRNLDWQYPDDLDRSWCRDEDVQQLERLLDMPDRRPVMLLGESLTGKTALIHEVVARRVERRQQENATTAKSVSKSARNTWLLSPQRLISGMSYVGQWEQRVHAILEAAQKKNLTLYFDDPIGLFRAGKSSCSNLCVADLLRKPLRDRDVRMLCEMTTAGYEQLLNLDRSFADLFHVFRIEPLGEDETLRVALQASRGIEQRQKTDFLPDVLPTVVKLQRQYMGHACFPGKAIRFLKQLGTKFPNQTVDRTDVVREMAETCGIRLPLVDSEFTLARDEVRHSFQRMIVGQDAAVDACVDLVMTQKAQLSPPGKPLVSMLFTGPTGIGKTETAKALAGYLFDDREKLVRFDLNEFKTSYSASRLVGTFDQPEGLLTSAIRHRPYSVILFDEIEKAHPDVFDVLLQVLGEGRLTDALGRTTDFGNTVIVMTSNLGAKQAGSTVGFVPVDDQQHYIAAAEKFFRPEFFNRIDRVVPFHSLNRKQIGEIAQRLMKDVVSREGLVRRRCVLDVGPQLISDIVDVGYDKAMGARGLKRAIEHNFTHPVAVELASIRSETPTLITVRKKNSLAGDDARLDVNVVPLINADPVQQGTLDSDEELLQASIDFLERIEAESFASRPEGEISGSGMSPELLHYFSLVEHANEIRETISKLRERIDSPTPSAPPALPVSQGRRSGSRNNKHYSELPSKTLRRDLSAVGEIRHFLSDATLTDDPSIDPLQRKLIGQCRTLAATAASADTEAIFYMIPTDPETFRPKRNSENKMQSVYEPWTSKFRQLLQHLEYETELKDLSVDGKHIRFIHAAGCGVMVTLGLEQGYILFESPQGRIDLYEVGCVATTDPAFAEIRQSILSPEATPPPLPAGIIAPAKDLRVLRVTEISGEVTIDFESGTQERGDFIEYLTRMFQTRLPLPPEFVAEEK